MIQSLSLYAQSILRLVSHSRGRRVLNAQFRGPLKEVYKRSFGQAAQSAADWLMLSQIHGKGGMASWSVYGGWTSAYPETTGYIIPSLIEAARVLDEPKWALTAQEAALWLKQQQRQDGGWAGGYVHQQKPAVVFNTAQAMRGLYAMAEWEKAHPEQTSWVPWEEHLLKAGNWIVQCQERNGSWKKNAHLGEARVYDTYVAAVLAKLGKALDRPEWMAAARKQCEWVVSKQLPNGWWPDADNTIRHNDRPILHTIAYTLDGMLECGIELGQPEFYQSGVAAAKALKRSYRAQGSLYGRYDRNWNGSESFLCTGAAQLALTWLEIGQRTQDGAWIESAIRLAQQLKSIQHGPYAHIPETRGALFGSDPIWGRYEPFSVPNWGVKYALDLFLKLHQREVNTL
ncbi:hypothetical protein GC167_07775 [bacterium]|nr:hypothetical protein [bacterium]